MKAPQTIPASRFTTLLALMLSGLCASQPAQSTPIIADPGLGSLQLLAHDSVDLNRVDGLTFDRFGNLFAALEVVGNGGVSYIDTRPGAGNGDITRLLSGVSGIDQIDAHPSGALHFTSEHSPASTSNRLFRLDVGYGPGNIPTSAVATSITTGPDGLSNPEGLVTLTSNSVYGNAGDLLLSEDLSGGRLFAVQLSGDNGATDILVDTGAGLARPEGIALGDFGGLDSVALYVAETLNNNILRVAADGSFTVFGQPSAGGLVRPDNLEFGPDGFLYVSEDQLGSGRVLRYDVNGNEQVIATGFNKTAGLAFDPFNGDLYIAEQQSQNIWRLQFTPSAVPLPTGAWLLGLGLTLLLRHRRNQADPVGRIF